MTTAYGTRLSAGTGGQRLGLSLINHFLAAGHMAFGEITMGKGSGYGHQRADVVMIRKSWNWRVTIYEVKVTRSDFLGDVQSGKYEGYLPFCHQLVFATPRGLVEKKEVPSGCGLIVHDHDKGWHAIKSAAVRHIDVSPYLLFACLMRGYDESLERRSLADRMCLESNVGLADRAVSLGHDIRARLADQQSAWDAIKGVKEAIEVITGESSRDIHSAIWRLKGFINDIPNPEAFEAAKRLVAIASGLVWNRKETSEGGYALRQLEEYIEMVKGERGV